MKVRGFIYKSKQQYARSNKKNATGLLIVEILNYYNTAPSINNRDYQDSPDNLAYKYYYQNLPYELVQLWNV